MNHEAVPYLASPKKKSELHLTKKRQVNGRVVSGQLVSKDGTGAFKVVAGTPLLQPEGDPARLNYPIPQILLGDRAYEIMKHFYELGREHFLDNLYAYMVDTLGKSGIRKAFEQYHNRTAVSRYEPFRPMVDPPSPVPGISRYDFARSVQKMRPQWGKHRLEMLWSRTWATHLPDFVERIIEREPGIMVELGCGACLGTQAVVESCHSFQRLLTLDISFGCAKGAEALFIYQGQIKRVDPVVGNFWFLPVKRKSVDVVFSHSGLDEAREIDRVLEEVFEVLKPGGAFISASRESPNFPARVFDKLGFSADEKQEMASIARLYAGPDNLCEIAESKGLKTIAIVPAGKRSRMLFVFESIGN
ncbi:class I SAM-dependent methyltransferase [Candidatus Poribacteria bacterium]